MAVRSKSLSIIDDGLKVKGTVNAEGKLVIAGDVEGTLVGKNVVTAQGSHIVARAEVEDIVIAGNFEGDITARNSLRIMRTGNFSGNIVCKTLSLEAGGKLNGHVEPLDVHQTVSAAGAEIAGTEKTP
jgi:cytoskeletal protein CcmA (bactofilin family)